MFREPPPATPNGILLLVWACDFFTKDVWTAFGKVTYYVLFFIHVGTRRVKISGMTVQPDGPWVEQQARNLAMELAD